MSVADRRSFVTWVVYCLIAGGTLLVYALTSLAAGRGEYVLPLDDVYIHFQYAHQLANGQPYVYNPGLPPTSGATSFLYPFVLAAGESLGFRELNLGIWAMSTGALALLGSMGLIYRSGQAFAPAWLAAAMGAAFGLTGAVAWHFMSGMETGLVILFALLTVTGWVERRIGVFVIGATLLALVRPEGGVLALLAVGAWALRDAPLRPFRFRTVGQHVTRREHGWLLLPVLALGVQPVVNWLVTGSAVASGNRAKSILGSVPFYPDVVVGRIINNFERMLRELVTGVSPREGVYVPALFAVFALVGLVYLLVRRDRWLGLLLVGWFAAGLLAIATLDTAFWHFKRYQMPFMALLFPLAVCGVGWLWSVARLTPVRRTWRAMFLRIVVAVGLVAVVLPTSGPFLRYFAINTNYVYLQPLQMARWLRGSTSPNATVAVHDTGMLRYIGDRTTIDIVGLTTPDAAVYWRNGPGAVAEFLMRQRPDYIASYGHGHGLGLGLIADTSIYGDPLIEFPVRLDNGANVALAADYQAIYQPDWSNIVMAPQPMQPSALYSIDARAQLAQVDVADLRREATVDYQWRNVGQTGGFPSSVYEIDYLACAEPPCRVTDGGRLINVAESFDFNLPASAAGGDLVLVTRLHPVHAGTFDVYIDDTYVATRWIPMLPGAWLEIPTLIPAELVTTPLEVRIEPQMGDGHYIPYQHWLYPASSDTALPSTDPFTTFQDGAIRIYAPERTLQDDQLIIDLLWGNDGRARGDYKVFVHVLPPDSDQPVAQYDNRPLDGTLPPGNWLPGVIPDTFVVDLSELLPGRYRVMLGLYDPVTFERLQPVNGDEFGRLLIGEVEIDSDG